MSRKVNKNFKACLPFLPYEKKDKMITHSVPPAFLLIYLSLQIILPFERSYGDNSSVTLSPGKILIKFILSFPLICAST